MQGLWRRWTTAVGKEIGDGTGAAEDLERLAKPFKLTKGECAFLLASRSARAVNSGAMMGDGRGKVDESWNDLRGEAFFVFGGVAVCCFRLGFLGR